MNADDLAAVRKALDAFPHRGQSLIQAVQALDRLAARLETQETQVERYRSAHAALEVRLQEVFGERDNATHRANASDLMRDKWQAHAEAAGARETVLREALERIAVAAGHLKDPQARANIGYAARAALAEKLGEAGYE